MRKFLLIFVSLLFLSIHYGTILYINSSLLSDFFAPGPVGILFVLGAIGNALLFLSAAKIVRKFGKHLLLFTSLVITLLSTIGLAVYTSAITIAVSFIVYTSFVSIVFYCLDIYLEEISSDTITGRIRGIYLTVIGLGIAVGPFLLSFLSTIQNAFRPIYLVAASLLALPLLLSIVSFKSKAPKEHRPYHHALTLPWRAWWHAKSIRHVTLARLALESFFAFMVAYAPIYLHLNLGFEWPELGIMFTIMLLPFIFLEWPAGEVADRFMGEKELMIIGFLITSIALLFMPFIGKEFALWTIVLFFSRVGASLIETMTESYFFKHVDSRDTGLLSIFRLTRSVGSIGGVAVGVAALIFLSNDKTFYKPQEDNESQEKESLIDRKKD